MEWVYSDGGRKEAGFKGEAGDCVARAIAIATGIPYIEVYRRLADGNGSQRKSKRAPSQKKSANNGICTKRKWFKDYMAELGFAWTPTMYVGQGCKVHVKSSELPSGRIILNLSRHYAAVIDGVLLDTYDCSRGGTRCVYGYWSLSHE